PIVKIQRTIHAAAGCRRRAAILLCPIHPIWKTIVSGDVIKLPSRLVVPGTPRLSAVARDNHALIASQHHALRIVWIDPQLVIVIAAWRALNRRPRFSAIARTIRRSIGHV